MFVREAISTVQLIKAWFSSDTRQNTSQQQTNKCSKTGLSSPLTLTACTMGGRTHTRSPNKLVLYPQSVAFQWEDNTFQYYEQRKAKLKTY